MSAYQIFEIASLTVLSAILILDLLLVIKRPHVPSMKESSAWVAVYVSLALVFAGVLFAMGDTQRSGEFLTGWLLEYSLSIDNLFVFVIMMSSFKVPRKYQQEVLLAGIVIALILRLIFILAGAALIENFSWVFYFFGAWLLWTAFSQAREGVEEPDDEDEEPDETSSVSSYATDDGAASDSEVDRALGGL